MRFKWVPKVLVGWQHETRMMTAWNGDSMLEHNGIMMGTHDGKRNGRDRETDDRGIGR